MAKIKAGILSKVSGKVAGVVGGTWKGTNYLRELVKPANPNTALQQAQRGKMSFIVAVARQLVGNVLNPYLNKFCKTMSGYNWFCKENIKKLDGTPLAFDEAPVLSFGTLAQFTMNAPEAASSDPASYENCPTLPAGWTGKVVEALISEDGKTVLSHTSNVVGTQAAGYLTPAELANGAKGYIVAFEAAYDANGVLQQLSASQAVEITGTGE